MQLYKLTDAEGNTRNNTHWGVGTTHSLEVMLNPQLCTEDVLHAYTSPLLAALMYPAHTCLKNPLCFTVDGEIAVTDGTKVGCFSLTVTGTFELPELSLTHRIAFGILCTLELLSGKDKKFTQWAEKWLSNEDRSIAAAAAAAYVAAAVADRANDAVVAAADAYDAATAYVTAATYDAYIAAKAAARTAKAAYDAAAAYVTAATAYATAATANVAAEAANVVTAAADVAAKAAKVAANNKIRIDFQKLAEKALEY